MKRREELRSALLKRVRVFQDFWDKKLFQEVTVDADKSDGLVKILDSVVIMLEGGDENDLKVGSTQYWLVCTVHIFKL